ncbi:thioesterase family protein [Ophiocordyceps camponoti-floridani]|uniref:Thioesterase family protein n=1 Tax=Ophiocordyceps camponoti-floridani TaxID=2030778 RepID=A0A8H4VFG3_9HYPO|nr:thioesterase family protein [Ophiocordyceps camponoti-floridani]
MGFDQHHVMPTRFGPSLGSPVHRKPVRVPEKRGSSISSTRPPAMPAPASRRDRRRDEYPFMLDYRTRWNDNDMYDHVNNSIYNFLFDSVVNAYLADHCGIHPPTRPITPSSPTQRRITSDRVRYELGLFERGVEPVCAVCDFVHVFVDRAHGRPSPSGLGPDLRAGLERIAVPTAKI